MTTIDLPSTELLTAEDEVTLARRIEAGVFAGYLLVSTCPDWTTPQALESVIADGVEAWHRFYIANLRLAAFVAHRAARRFRVDPDDIIQECCLTLGRAIMAWDYTRGIRFSTLAWPRLDSTAQQTCLYLTGRPRQWLRARAVPEDCATGWVRRAQAWRPPVFLVDDSLPAPQDDSTDESDVVLSQLRCLGAEERRVVEARFGLSSGKPCSYNVIAKDLGTSPYHVKRIETSALARLESRVTPLL